MWIFKYALDVAIPAISAYLASDETIIQWLISNQFLPQGFKIALFQRICLIINIFFTTFVLYMRMVYHSHKEEQCRKEIAGLYNMIKQFAQSALITMTKNKNFSFDLRIFVPEVSVSRWLKATLMRKQKEKWFVIRNIEPFAKKDITEHLKFRVEPAAQGLVGSAYSSGSIVYDDNLESTNSTEYSLEQTQLSRTSSLKWSICVPILNDNNEVIAVMAFDSDKSNLNIEKNKIELKNMTNTIAIMMRDSVPELFKRKWSL